VSSERDAADGADDGYVHEPGRVDSDAATGVDTDAPSAVDADSMSAGSDETDEGFGQQGWLLVAGVVVCFLVIPGVIYLKPAAPAGFGLPFLATFLVLPLVPAVVLGLLAVWSMRAAA